MGHGFGSGQEGEIHNTEVAASRLDKLNALDESHFGSRHDDNDYPFEADDERHYFENYESLNGLPDSAEGQLDDQYFHNYERENGLWPSEVWSNDSAPSKQPFPKFPPRTVTLAADLDLTSQNIQCEGHTAGEFTVVTKSVIGVGELLNRTFGYQDSISSQLISPESFGDFIKATFANIKAFASGAWYYKPSRRCPISVDTCAITRKLYELDFPEESRSPTDTIGYSLVCSPRGVYPGEKYDPLEYGNAILIFPKTRDAAEALHAKAVEHLAQGKSTKETIRFITAYAKLLNIPTFPHGFYPGGE